MEFLKTKLLKRYSASYGGTKENFLIAANFSSSSIVEKSKKSIYSVLKNILHRGNPTKASVFLKSKLGKRPFNSIFLYPKEKNVWNNIKGDKETGYNPARIFIEEILPNYLGEEYSFVTQLMWAEADFKYILSNNREFYGQQVDFYCPLLRLVIEIDGYTHSFDDQKRKDALRDKALKREKIKVIRFSTEELKSKNKKCETKLNHIKEIVISSEEIVEYIKCKEYTEKSNSVKFDVVMRLQTLLVELLLAGVVREDGKPFNIFLEQTDISSLDQLLFIAYDDIRLWISVLAQLAKVSINLPVMNVVTDRDIADVCLDFSMFQRYTDIECGNNEADTIFVRTCYRHEVNEFLVSCAEPIKYQFSASSETEDNKSLSFLLSNLFSLSEFRNGQLDIIKNILAREDTIGILPTGTGKSLCYQLACLLNPGISIVVVPIISLMEDQKRSLNDRGIQNVTYVNSMVTGDVREHIQVGIAEGRFQIIMISPERLQNEEFLGITREAALSKSIPLVVLDEVHCLSEWGHDFRVAYLRLIPTIRQCVPKVCLLGLTATASQAVLNDLKVEFDNNGSGVKALASMNRDELQFTRIAVSTDQERIKTIESIVQRHRGEYLSQGRLCKKSVGMIFCQAVGDKPNNKPSCKSVYHWIAEMEGMADNVEIYHGRDMTPSEKKASQGRFMESDFDGVMVCTSSFGMGIDKENVKYTIHASLPQSIESFYQQAGRAGRDVDKSSLSYCYVLFSKENKANINMLSELFNPYTTVDRRRILSKELSSDLQTNMYFWNLNKVSVEEEREEILALLRILYKNENRVIAFSSDDELSSVQYNLYKLALLGTVNSWQVKYHSLSSGLITVDYIGVVAKDMEVALLTYIRKYDSEFTLDSNVSRYKVYQDILNRHQNVIHAYVEILIVWTNYNILSSRLQSLYNMYQFCTADISDEEFKERLSDYFKYTEETIVYDNIVKTPLAYDLWFTALKEDSPYSEQIYIGAEKAKKNIVYLMRYLESYSNNTGLNYIVGMLRLIGDDFKGTEGEWRLNSAFDSIKESFSYEEASHIVEESIKIAETFSFENKNIFSEIVLKNWPDKVTLIQTQLKDYYSLSCIIDGYTLRLKQSMEGYSKWTI